jgi:L-rhamnose-H+ transport protein
MNPTVYGLLVILLAGAIGSATLLPMKFVTRWRWENTWLVYATFAYAIAPLIVAWWSIPRLGEVYRDAGAATVAPVVLLGFGWGLSVVMLGLAVAAVGLSVSTGIIMGSSIALGSLIPLMWLGKGRLLSGEGLAVLASDAVLLVGVALCARAGYLRDRVKSETEARPASGAISGARGIGLCFAAGILTTLLNLALAQGGAVTAKAVEYGATVQNANNAVWGLAVSAGAIPSVVFCLVLLGRNASWSEFFSAVTPRNVAICVGMATFFITATVGYGMGAAAMGSLGPVVGWPVYISSLIIGNNFWGWVTGEWNNSQPSTFATMVAGIALQVVGISVPFLF